jgi:hypothetical protein
MQLNRPINEQNSAVIQYEDEHQYKVDRENEALLERLLDIRRTKGKIDHWNPNYQPRLVGIMPD